MSVLDLVFRRSYSDRVVYMLRARVDGMSASDLYNQQPALRSVISFLSDNIAALPLKCYVRKPDGSRERDRDSALAKLLAHPNGHMTGHELVRDTVSEYLLHNDGYWLTIPADTKSGWQLEVIPTDWATPKTLDGLTETRVIVRNRMGGQMDMMPGDYIRFCGWSPYGAASYSEPVESLKDILREQIDAWQFRGGIWKNQGRVTQWISRPADTPWGDGARDRFAESWRNKFAGNGGTDTGGTPLLEDGMRLENATFNAREAQWAEVLKLAREDVCAVYHLNPSHIYHTDAQTYASAKDNARALYSDTIAPLLDFFEERINAFLVPRLGLDDTHYCEFDLSAKLQGSFEEQATVISSAVGAPWMTRHEARERFNLPRLEGSDADELVTPLNVLVGGQASPQDVDGVESPYANGTTPSKKSAGIKVKGAPEDADAKEISGALAKFFKRQSRSITAKLEKGRKADDFESWWDDERWERELADDLTPIFQRQAARRGRQAYSDAGFEGEFSAERIENYIKAMAKGKSKAINDVTYRQLIAALEGVFEEGAMGATVSGVFEKAEETRADTSGISFATAIAGFAILEACRQADSPRRTMKTWIVTSGNPRPEHAAMNGETVPYGEVFSNGANFPGDQTLTPDQSCGCQCQVEITIP